MPLDNFKSFIVKSDRNKKENIDNIGRKLSYAYRTFDPSCLPLDTHDIIELDLTENTFTGATDLRFLMNLTNLQTLILDKNRVQSNFNIPHMHALRTLCVNDNHIENLEIFIQHLQESCPQITYLSMLKNKAAPSYFNGGSLNDHNDYRLYVASKLLNLKMLDDKEITLSERSQAKSLYGTISVSSVQKRTLAKKQKESTKASDVNTLSMEISRLPNFDRIYQSQVPPPHSPPPPPLEALPHPPILK